MKGRKHKYLAETKADKQLRLVLISMIGSIMLCMAFLIGSTWAWFQTTITSEGNVITIGEMKVSVMLDKGEISNRSTVVPSGQYTYQLNEVGEYQIVLINSGSIPGYCNITLTDNNGNTEEFTSGTLYPTDDGLEDAATIKIEITAMDSLNNVLPVNLEITPHWGEDPNYAVVSLSEDGLFLPEETEPETTEDTQTTEPTDKVQPQETTESAEPESTTGSTEPTDSTVNTEPTEPTESTVNTEPTEPAESTVNTEPTESADSPETTATTDPVETEPQSNSEPTTQPTETVEPKIQSESPTEETQSQ